MTPAAKVLYSAALLIGLSVGAFFGFQKTTATLESYQSLRRLIAPAGLGDFSYMQYRYATREHANAALQTYAWLLEEMDKFAPDDTQKRDLAFTYTRLALLEDAVNNPEESRAYMIKAQSWYAAGRGPKYSESEMKAALKALDERLRW